MMPSQSSNTIAVVIPTYNEELNIQGCLESIRNQTFELPYEILVVDSSSDETPSIIRNEFPQVRLIHSETRLSIGAARNIGIQNTSSEVLVFIDADCIAPPNWIQNIFKRFETYDYISGVGGSYANGSPHDIMGTIGYLLEYFNWLPNICSRKFEAKYFLGGACAFKRKVFRKVNFIEDFVNGNDVCLSATVARQGFQLFFDPSLVVHHRNRTGWKKFCESQFKAGEGSAVVRCHQLAWGHFFTRYPLLIFAVPFWILPKMLVTFVLKLCWKEAFRMIVFFPIFVLGNFTWAYGFYRYSLMAKRKRSP